MYIGSIFEVIYIMHIHNYSKLLLSIVTLNSEKGSYESPGTKFCYNYHANCLLRVGYVIAS